MDRIRAILSLTVWVALIGASLTALHTLGADLPIGAIWSSSSVELGLGAAARLLGLVAGYWLLISTVIYLGGSLGRLSAAVRSVDWATLPWVRRVADQISARALVRVLAAPLSLLDLVTPGYVPVPAGDPPPLAPTNTTTPPEAPIIEAPVEALVPIEPFASPRARPAAVEAIEVIIRSGDNMWRLAEARLQDLMGRPPTDSEIAPYWRRVVEANQNRIKSGEPDLIFPGEVLILPPV